MRSGSAPVSPAKASNLSEGGGQNPPAESITDAVNRAIRAANMARHQRGRGLTEVAVEAEAGSGRIVVPAGAARAVRLPEGQRVRVVNSEGGQVVDTWAFCAFDPAEHLSMAHSRSATYRIFFRIGDVLVTNRFRPVLRIAEDTSPGFHDTLHAACSAESNRFYGVSDSAPNCEDNLRSALAEQGIRTTAVPCPWNLYEHADVDPAGELHDRPASAAAGDYVELECLMDLILACSACPSRVGAISGAGREPRGAEILIV